MHPTLTELRNDPVVGQLTAELVESAVKGGYSLTGFLDLLDHGEGIWTRRMIGGAVADEYEVRTGKRVIPGTILRAVTALVPAHWPDDALRGRDLQAAPDAAAATS